MPGNRCTNCITYKIECTHSRLKGADTSISSSDPVQDLKTAQEHVATILSTSTVYIPSNDPSVLCKILAEVAKYARDLEQKLVALEPQTLPITNNSKPASPIPDPSSPPFNGVSNDKDLDIQDALRGLIPSDTRAADLFFGKSSSVQFVKAAMQVHGNTSYVIGTQRPEFWTTLPWEKLKVEAPPLFFPENDLLEKLVKIYFDQINPIMSILHFPSFRDAVADRLHFRDQHFGAVVLVVCALASRYSDDPRVFLEGANSEHSCGWKWFSQVRPLRASFSPEPSLHQLQLICLSVIYLAGTSTPEECWILAGLGIRFAQGTGAHNRTQYTRMKPLEGELYKRVFWILVVSDTIMSSLRGRPQITHTEDFDIDMPVDCDDEYWGQPNAVQPRGKPSTSTFFIMYLHLMDIFGRIQRAIYPVTGQVCDPGVVAELDSALNEWVDSIPDHLRWDPHREDQIFLDQSAALYAPYYHAQILIHRPFIPAPGKASMTSGNFPSLAICANAARSCGHVMDVQARRGRGLLHHPHVTTALFDSAVVLLINVWGDRKTRTPEDFNRATADTQNCVRVLRLYERRWRVAGRKCDIISAMLNLGKYTSDSSLKRARNAEEVTPSPIPSGSGTLLDAPEQAWPMGDSTRVLTIAQQIQELELSIQETDHLFSLPLHTEELGRLPIYDSFDYDFNFPTEDAHYQPQSHVYNEYAAIPSGVDMPQQFGYDVVPGLAPGNICDPQHAQQTESSSVNGASIPSYNIPSGDSWEDWSVYLASVDQFNQGSL
ncbi:fungal-specific transcription factor domain-containing protein [Mycena sp. CBHHK59/15]|nr:fungal-specific transcription factor domain-containing protein [Mycena sp. CBHHK59/15]